MNIQDMVTEFHRTFNIPIAGTVTDLGNRAKLRADMIIEEVEELGDALGGVFIEDSVTMDLKFCDSGAEQNIIEIADALGDIVYLCYGTAIEIGIDLDNVLREIHRSNMSKLGADGKPIYAENGKVMKGPRYTAPDIARVIGVEEMPELY